MKRIRGFTLVELLVVIAIIAVLISILLPVLGGARRAADQAKCASSLRQIGQAFQLYAVDFKGAAPPWRAGNTSGTSGGAGGSYDLYGVRYNMPNDLGPPATNDVTAKDACFWFDFLGKYLTTGKGGSGDQTKAAQAQTQQSVIWSCAPWQGYAETSAGSNANIINGGAGLNRQYVGISYNYEPTMGAGAEFVGNPANLMYGKYSNDIRSADNFTTHNFSTVNGQTARWFKLKDYKPAENRALCGDSYDWKLEAQQWDGTCSVPGVRAPQQKLLQLAGNVYPGGTRVPGTTFDYYRHGKYPPIAGNGQVTNSAYFKSVGGKIAYNILYADGHVLESSDRADAYRSMFNMFPVIGTPGSRPCALAD